MKNVIETFLQGSRHSKNSLPCEDRTFSLSKNGVNAIALADGAGSKKYTHAAQGAECVCEEICKLLCTKFDEFYGADNMKLLRRAVMVRCQNALLKKAKELELDSIERLSSTLLAAAVKDDKAVFIHIGDGVIGKVTQSEVQVVSEPQNGEFASTTYFITLSNAEEYIHIIKGTVEDDAVYFLMSDGTSEYCYNESDCKLLSGAAKMALMVYDDDGQDKLTDTVRNMLIGQDEYSDDCSFIALRVSDKRPPLFMSEKPSSDENDNDGENKNPIESLETGKDTPQAETDSPPLNENELKKILESFDSADPHGSKDKETDGKKAKTKISSKAVIAIICAAVIAVAVVVGVLVSKRSDDNKQVSSSSSNQLTAEEQKSDNGTIVTEDGSKTTATEKSSETSTSSTSRYDTSSSGSSESKTTQEYRQSNSMRTETA